MLVPVEIDTIDLVHSTVTLRRSGGYRIAQIRLPAEVVQRHGLHHGDPIEFAVLLKACPKVSVLSDHDEKRDRR